MSFWGGGARALSIVVSLSVLTVSVMSGTAAFGATPDDPSGKAAAYEASSGAVQREESSPALVAQAAADADPSKFIAGELVSDAVFFNGSALSQSAIQSLLTAKGAGCTATGTYGCLKSTTFNTPAKSASAACSAIPALSNASAAQVFAAVGTACSINPLVLVVMVQKEQGLVSTTAPTQWMYDHATGWQCPDVGADPQCDDTPTSTGFFNQVFGAAWQFQQYGKDPYFDWFPVGKVSNVRLNLDATCGTKKVAIWNKATAALYYYTPYTPNDASLASYPGEGDDCSAYGIRNFWMLFNAWSSGPSVAGGTPTSTRAAGADRFAAAVSISQQTYPTPPTNGTVYIANGLNFPDALGAAPAAAKQNGPLLLVTPDSVPGVVATELQRLHPDHIRVVGGVNSVSAAVYSQLAGFTPDIARFQGADRYDASRQLVSSVWTGTVPRLFIATGANFPDALSAGAAAGTLGVPVLLVNGSAATLDDPTVALIQQLQPGEVDVVGGPNSVSSGIYAQLDAMQGVTAKRFSGNDRFAVSAALNADTTIFPTLPSAYLANGFTFPDALAGAAAAAKAKSPLYVAQAGCVTAPAAEAALNTTSKTFRLLGGTASIGVGVEKLTVCP